MSGFWNGRKVLITGHTGFKGVWLTKWLDMLGAKTLGIALPPDEHSVYGAVGFSGGHKSLFADVRDGVAIINAARDFSPEIIFHLAAQAIVGEAKKAPAFTFETNLMGTVNLLEASRAAESVRAAVIITSDKVYENIETLEPYPETARLGGDEPYAASKACAELAVAAYRNAVLDVKKTGVATARAANVFGGGDLHYDRLIPYLTRAKITGETPEIRSPGAVRPWQYVLSPLKGYLILAENLYNAPETFSGAFNFGPPDDELYTVGEIAAMIAGDFQNGAASGFKESGLLRIDSSKSRAMLNWNPIVDIKQGIEETVEFYRAMFAGGDLSALMGNAVRRVLI